MQRKENARCSVHGKYRLMCDLKPREGFPNQWECIAGHECRAQNMQLDMVTCAIHGKRRNKTQMKEVAPGVWECPPHAQCRNMIARDTGYSGAQMGGDDFGETFAPMAPMAAPQMGGAGGLYGMAMGEYGQVSAMSDDVWCAKHGKKIQKSHAVAMEGGVYYVCRDESMCLASELKDPKLLQAEGCPEVLCGDHGLLRGIKYVELSGNRVEYRCKKIHACRYCVVPQ